MGVSETCIPANRRPAASVVLLETEMGRNFIRVARRPGRRRRPLATHASSQPHDVRCEKAPRGPQIHAEGHGGRRTCIREGKRPSDTRLQPGQIGVPEHWPHRAKIAEPSPSHRRGLYVPFSRRHRSAVVCRRLPWLLLVALVEKSHIPTGLLVACAGGGERTFFASSHPDQISRAVSQLCL